MSGSCEFRELVRLANWGEGEERRREGVKFGDVPGVLGVTPP